MIGQMLYDSNKFNQEVNRQQRWNKVERDCNI